MYYGLKPSFLVYLILWVGLRLNVMYPISSPIEAWCCMLIMVHYKRVLSGSDFRHIGATKTVTWKINGPFGMIQHQWLMMMVYVFILGYFKCWLCWFNKWDIVIDYWCAHISCHTFVQFWDFSVYIHLPCIRCPPVKFSNFIVVLSHDIEIHITSCSQGVCPNEVRVNYLIL